MIDESSRRRPDFAEGHKFVLADGQHWHFREPVVDWYPRFVDGKTTLAMATDLGTEFDALLGSVVDQARWDDLFVIAFGIAATMLRANYELSDEEVGTLLRHRPGDEDSTNRYMQIIEVARGNAPKLTPGGSD